MKKILFLIVFCSQLLLASDSDNVQEPQEKAQVSELPLFLPSEYSQPKDNIQEFKQDSPESDELKLLKETTNPDGSMKLEYSNSITSNSDIIQQIWLINPDGTLKTMRICLR